MILEQWQTYLTGAPAAGVRLGDGHGAPARQAAPAGGVATLPDLALVRFEGTDARKFLQGYLTCDTDLLAERALTPAALCNLKGRVVMNGWCALSGYDVLLVLHRSLLDDLATFLRAYLMFSKAKLARPDALVFGTLDHPDGPPGLVMDARRRLILCDDIAAAQRLWESSPHVAAEEWLAALTADGIPLVSAPVSQAFLPQMLNLEALGAIDFTKGCYLGQEVVARAQHRGQVKRRLAQLTWSGDEPPAAGAEVIDSRQRSVGIVVQSAINPTSGPQPSGPLLAVLQPETAAPLMHGSTRLEPVAQGLRSG
jgi:tRNA-modifying protein YgfZ